MRFSSMRKRCRYNKVGYAEPEAGSTNVLSPEEEEFVMADR